jgi:hypothetical protein
MLPYLHTALRVLRYCKRARMGKSQDNKGEERPDAKEEIQATLSLYLFLRSVPRGVDSSQEISFVSIVLIIDHL